MATVAIASPNATRRFRVMNCLRACARARRATSRARRVARLGTDGGVETMMAAPYPHIAILGHAGAPRSGDLVAAVS
jgi:hypothetical protein